MNALDLENSVILSVIDRVELSSDKERLTVWFRDGSRLVGETYGDCCSNTWIEHLTVPPGVSGSRLLVVDEYISSRSVTDDDDLSGEFIQEYQDAIRTSAGEIIIEYRNSSNGYYGGSIEWAYVAAT